MECQALNLFFCEAPISYNVPSIYDVAIEGSNVPKGKGVSP